ncbi:hypothetical protein SAMN05192558_11469 [Actinokineospora alba]|uniref:Uncharacterized protein n=1 Tax=Actinokineospora alba TaxID=504798 RepID=A0A1H0VJH8_9PSEU|nr:hypothetical protein [Actinokineospora alba]SDJ28249.1 hypothetical protein SAMN05421871_11269 [Actinokineospora alba]SDP78378.1 hypothetical protein SAMN05192558_11469 [Actinokineospora alba]
MDFVSGVSDTDRAGIEAAMEAAGILDAWVTPDGRLLDTDDTTIVAQDAVPGPALASVLVPAIDPADDHAATLTETGINAVLRAIGLGPNGSTWVDVDGRFAIGVLSGAWHKDSAIYIGEGARESARRGRLADLRSELERLRQARTEFSDWPARQGSPAS